MSEILSPKKLAEGLIDLWSPKVIGQLEDFYIKVAKIDGSFVWHEHEDEDELFYILSGELRMEMKDKTHHLKEGDLFIVPKGVPHNPVTEKPCLVMLIERKTTKHTGGKLTEQTKSIQEQLA